METIVEAVMEPFYGFPDDVVVKDEWKCVDMNITEGMIRADDVSLIDRVTKNMLAYYKENGGRKLLPAYKEWIERCVSDLEEQLEALFPGRWDIQRMQRYWEEDSQILKDLYCIDGNVNATRTYDSFSGPIGITVVIYFPNLVVTNSAGDKWPIKDYYVLLDFSIRMGVSTIRGYRATKSVVEYRAGYTFSHSNVTVDDVVGFCFGATELDELVAELRMDPYDSMRISLLFQQLEDYLSWESIDGVPYYPIKRLLKPESNAAAPNISSTRIASMAADLSFMVQEMDIRVAGTKTSVTINIASNKKFRELVTSVCPADWMFPRDELTGRSLYVQPSVSVNIEAINTSAKLRGARIRFKGKPVYLTVEADGEDEKKSKVEVEADSRVVEQVKDYIRLSLQKYVIDRFWADEKRKVQ